jgi:nucleoside-diphosphate-sugar epimerase
MTKSVLIIGGNGYIGSRLIYELNSTYSTESVDLCWYGKDFKYSYTIDYNNLTKEYINKFDAIVLLAGHSSVKMCIGDINSSWNNNVNNFNTLVSKLDKEQLLIYASSGSVYGITDVPLAEDTAILFKPINNYDLTKYSLEVNAQKFITEGYNIVGLRFGTVNGWSPNVREELMINSMTKKSIDSKILTINNVEIQRPILGITDLTLAVKAIIETPKFGIYNLASFSDTVEHISSTVSQVLHSNVQRATDIPNAYNFLMDVNKFKTDYNFMFNDTTTSIVTELVHKIDTITFSNRNQYKIYE